MLKNLNLALMATKGNFLLSLIYLPIIYLLPITYPFIYDQSIYLSVIDPSINHLINRSSIRHLCFHVPINSEKA